MELERLLRQQAMFTKESAKGFNHCKCPVCNDYQERMGVKFEFGNIGVNCFNCGFKTRYNELDGNISKNMKKLLEAFGVDAVDIEKLQASTYLWKKQQKEKDISVEILKTLNTSTPEVDLPEGSVLLETAPNSPEKSSLLKYLATRKFEVSDYPWYFIPPDHSDDYLKSRIIIPYFRNKRIIYWQARTILPHIKKRYLNCDAPKGAVIFGYDELYSWSSKPLFITEGVFDALCVNGVCLLGSTLSEQAIAVLRKTKRRVIFVIDKDKKGKMLAEQVVNNGWEITWAPEGSNDINDSFVKYGKLFTVWHLLNNTSSGFVAKTRIKMM